MARPRFLLVAALASLWLTGSLAAADAPLLAGVASADITPPPGLNLWGYTNRTHGATGTLDPLTAKALVLKQGETCVALVALDLGRTPEDPLLEKLRADVRASSGVDHLFATASHTHSAPSLESSDGPNQFGPQVVVAMQRAIDEAARRLAPVTLAIGRGTVELAHNRRRYLPDGRVAMQWRNAEREKTEPVDPRFTVLRLDDADGKPVAVLLHYACHPVVLGPDNYEYSADFVGAARSLIEERLGTTCLFLQGACGNINPYDDKTPLTQGGLELMRRMGRALGQAAVEQARSATPDASREPSLQSVRREIPLKLRWDLGDARVRQILSAAYGRRFDNYLSKILSGDRVNVELNVVLLNEQVA
ncbi:MAG: neutral/alkaline non-lysosomal ceramidase N-terminal domain-containing protein, partial [Planctomycetaceae bacterium]|nr:neutral/alkaline non-lysosomal ceramidase N-terminal domain-containing protein [Planctomycetaceae bacterium]